MLWGVMSILMYGDKINCQTRVLWIRKYNKKTTEPGSKNKNSKIKPINVK